MTLRRNDTYFSSLTHELNERAARATLGLLSPSSDALRRHLGKLFERPPGSSTGFLADPVFEATFGWQTAERNMEQLAADGVLHEDLVAAMDAAEGEARFARTRLPFAHQVQAWQALQEQPPRSVVVSSGTGSGKTECFLVPILDDLTRQSLAGPLTGVRALFLYPLNALINSQRDRLRAWTNALGRRVRFCLYNGNTPGSLPVEVERRFPQEVGARDTLRGDPPPILVTNATMLEYMLVRQEDRPILDLSRGVLRWIVLDEAHTYVGSQAAEIALLLRRVIHAFGVQSKDVRFIATSATIGKAGDAGSIEQLRGYLSSIAGVSPEQITVIEGHRQVPPLPPADESASLPVLESLAAMSPRLRHDSLARVPSFRELRDRLTGQAATLAELAKVVFTDISDESRACTLRLLDLARHAELDGAPLLPLRGHIFHRTQRGLWACCSRSCSGRAALGLDDPSWPFGKTFVEHRDHCDADACEGLVFEVVLCSRCGAEYLSAQRSVVDQRNCYVPAPVLRGGDAEESLDEELDDEQEQTKSVLVGHRRLLGRYEARETDDHAATQPVRFERETGHFSVVGDVSLVEVGIRAKRANLYCANCGEGEKNAGDLLRPVQTGGAFHLGVAIPTLLEFSPPAESANRPFAGRRTITFSDSRQGTARFALRTQIDAERNYVRSYIYHLVEDRRPPPGQRQQDEAKLAELEPMLPGLPPGVRAIVEQQLVEIRQRLMGAAGGSVSWADAIARFSSSPAFTSWLVPQWRDRIDSPVRQAHFMLLREFARRPKRQNSLETLGLVRVNYRALAQGLLLPPDARRVQLTVDEWRDFLKLLLDFVVRAQSAVIFDPPDATRWMGTAMAPKFLRGPEAEPDDDNRIRLWPYVRHGRRHRFVELLAAALNLDLSEEDDLRAVQGLLAAAWTQLHDLRLLQRDESGSRMNLEDSVELTTVDRAWFCPVTRRILDTTFRGYSPFPLGQVFRKAEPLTMPRLPFPFPQNGDRLSAALPEGAIEDWLATDTAVRAARDRGVWSDFCDRIAAFASYYRVGEHSAQQSAGRLEELEREFKAARVNLLSCSTTMEMGVDIGGLSTVAMNNAPPSPANFLQRAGRAGRRGETAAVSLTMCKSQPHGEAIFRDPLWPFTTPIHVPSVSLQSERIVQRHVNALLLTHFLLTRANDALRLTMTSFFESPGSTVSSHAELFRLWLHEPPSAAVGAGIQQLTEGSCLGGLALSQLQLRTEGALDAVTDPWLRELKALKDSLDEVGGPPATNQSTPSAAQLAISRQLARLRGEYLLSELSTRGFLPGHGFPIGLVPFIHTNIEQLRRERAAREDRRRRRAEGNLQAHEREDSPFRRGGFPTRSLPTAIREYAPGSTVVIDGLVHHSEGVTLNWHLPPGDQPPSEIQAFRHAWRCKSCGAAGTSAAEVAACEVCGNEDLRPIRYLQPAGFAVQISERPTNILEGSTYIPARDPWISAGRGVWYDLPRPELGRVRVSERGQLFYRSGGLHGEGYALCLHCGYAVSMPARPSGAPYARPNVLDGHRHLRGGRSPKGDARCPGNDNPHASRFGQFLGAAIETDVLELQLHDTTLQAPLNDETVTTTIAAALRRALAEELGIDDREIGWAQIPSRGRHDDQRGRSIVLFDTAEGGAGYVSEAPRMLPKLLRAAREILACPRACDRACHACLLTFDTQHKLDRLDRNKALQALSQDILAALDLPPELHVFGDGENRYELEPLPVALAREFQRTGATDIQVFLDGDAEEWELEAWPLRDLVVRWSLAGTKVALCVDPTTFEALHATERSLLAALADLTNITVHVTPPPVLDRGARLIAVTSNVRQQTRWAAIGEIANPPGANWASSMRLVASNSPTMTNAIAAPPLRSSRIRRPLAHTMREIVIHAQFDGCPITEFGARFWRIVGAGAPDFATRLAHGRTISAIEYCDRYFRSALVVRLFLELFKGLKAAGAAVSATKVQIVTLRCDPRRTGRNVITDDWAVDAARQAVLERMFDGHAAIEVAHKESRSIEHARQLKVTWSDGQHMLVRLDEGLGFLESSARFDISRRPEDQARTLATLAFNLTRLRPQLATYLYVQDV